MTFAARVVEDRLEDLERQLFRLEARIVRMSYMLEKLYHMHYHKQVGFPDPNRIADVDDQP